MVLLLLLGVASVVAFIVLAVVQSFRSVSDSGLDWDDDDVEDFTLEERASFDGIIAASYSEEF